MSASNLSQLQVGWPPNYPAGVSSQSIANIIKISRMTFATGALGHVATASSTTTFVFPGLATGSLLYISPASSLSTAFVVSSSFVSAANVGALQLNNVASIATLSPKVWQAIAYTFDT